MGHRGASGYRRERATIPHDEDVPAGPWLRALLSGQRSHGGFGVHWDLKWTGGHWRLIQLVELEIPAGEARAVAAVDVVLAALTSPQRVGDYRRALACLCQRGGQRVAVSCRLGLADDSRVRQIVEWLLAWQWPDGG